MEVPQLVEINGRYYLIFCVGRNEYAAARQNRPGIDLVTGTHYMVADHPLGPYNFLSDHFLHGDEVGSHYAGKVIRNPAGEWILMTSHSWTSDGGFIGEIANPIPLHVATNGQLSVNFK